jgi:hypothetical protein
MMRIYVCLSLSLLVPASIGFTSMPANALPLKEDYQSIPVFGYTPSGLYDPAKEAGAVP